MPYRKSSSSEVSLGDRVLVKGKHYGVVRYVGKTAFDTRGEWVGVELDAAEGRHNGTVKGKTYLLF